MTFRPSLLTSWGSWQTIEGDWDGTVLWLKKPNGNTCGIHLATKTEIEPLDQVAEAKTTLAEGINKLNQQDARNTDRNQNRSIGRQG